MYFSLYAKNGYFVGNYSVFGNRLSKVMLEKL